MLVVCHIERRVEGLGIRRRIRVSPVTVFGARGLVFCREQNEIEWS